MWGFYTLIEEIDKIFLETHYGNKDGDLFKSIGGNLEYLGPDGTSYHKWYELKTNKDENNFTDLINFTDKINNTPSAFWADSVAAYHNLTAYIKQYAASMLFASLDSYTGSGRTYFLYKNTKTHKFEFIVWDANTSFGQFPVIKGITNLAMLNPYWVPSDNNPGKRPLNEKILQQEALKQ